MELKLTYEPTKGIYLKGMIGKQRHSFDDKLINGNGIIRAIDGELNLNELLDSSNSWKLKATLVEVLLVNSILITTQLFIICLKM
jgi:hypothetical protein